MGESRFTSEQRQYLLELARSSLCHTVAGNGPLTVDRAVVPPDLTEPGACFVTLFKEGKVRGCVGSILPVEPLYQSVLGNARKSAVRDHRFENVEPQELPKIHLEISVLSVPKPVEYDAPEQLLSQLRPGVDGVVVRSGRREATYLPQVWAKVPEKEAFLNHLCRKARLSASAWKRRKTTVMTYQVESFEENGSEAVGPVR